jgi:hypothetical protein
VAAKTSILFAGAIKLKTSEKSTVNIATKPNLTHIFLTQYNTTTERIGNSAEMMVPIISASRNTVFSW